MKGKNVKKLICVVFVITFFGLTTFSIDSNRIKKAQKPIFVIQSPMIYKDGGTKVYYGMGYKVIEYHVLEGRSDTVIGSWLLKYSAN